MGRQQNACCPTFAKLQYVGNGIGFIFIVSAYEFFDCSFFFGCYYGIIRFVAG